MVSLEQIKLLESKVTTTIDYLKKVTGENKRLKEKLDSYQVRIDELEILVLQFKEDQSKIEDGILSALDRLNQFEDAVESVLSAENKSLETTTRDKNPSETATQEKSKEEKKTAGPEPQKPEPSKPEPPKMEPQKIEEKSSEEGELDIF